MGIDPVTHEPLQKDTNDEKSENSKSQGADNFQKDLEMQLQETNGSTSSEQQSSSPTDQNSSSGESNLSLYENDPLISCLFGEDYPDQVLDIPNWETTTPSVVDDLNNFCASSWDENCSWLMDCQDFGIHDFGLDCFTEVDIKNTLDTLQMPPGQ